MALITLANPLKNFLPCSAVSIASNSLNEAPAQNATVPPDRKTMTFVFCSSPALCISWLRSFNIAAGKELPCGMKKFHNSCLFLTLNFYISLLYFMYHIVIDLIFNPYQISECNPYSCCFFFTIVSIVATATVS